MTLYRIHKRLRNGNLRQVCCHLGANENDARARAERCGCVAAGEPAVLIAESAIHELAPAGA